MCVTVRCCRPRTDKRTRNVLAYASALPFAAFALTQQAASTAAPASAAAVGATAQHLPALLSSAGVLILCCAAAALLLAGIPLLWSLARAANRMESMLQVCLSLSISVQPAHSHNLYRGQAHSGAYCSSERQSCTQFCSPDNSPHSHACLRTLVVLYVHT